jgi:hypothetical protein
MARCAGFKPNGEPCERIVGASQSYCFGHDPVRKEERRRNASKAGKGKASKVAKGLHELLEDLTTRVVDGKLEPYQASVAGSLVGVRLRLLEFERKVKEQDEIVDRLEALETRAQEKKRGGNQQWGA